MRDERLEVSVTFDERHGYVASAPELRVAISLGGLRREARGMTQAEVDRLWSTACTLVRARETSIRCVAVELQRRRALSGEEIDAIAWPRRQRGRCGSTQ